MAKPSKTTCAIVAIIALVTGGAYQADVINTEPVGEVVIAGKQVGHLKVSPKALEIIGNAEGCRKTPYKCPAGLLTDGIGNTRTVTGKPKTDEQIAIDWVKNIMDAERCIDMYRSPITLTQGQRDAFTSFVFNTGCTVFRRNSDKTETQIYKFIKAGDYRLACKQLNRWVYSGGQRLNGLVKRRQLETELCLQT